MTKHKIKSLKQLQNERIRTIENQRLLELKIAVTWDELKKQVAAKEVLKKAIKELSENKAKENLTIDGLLRSAFTFGLSVLAEHLANHTEEQIGLRHL